MGFFSKSPQIWDTAGQERFHSLTTSFFKRAEGFVLVYDVSNRQSFESVSTWMKDIVEVSVVRGSSRCNVRCAFRSIYFLVFFSLPVRYASTRGRSGVRS